MKFKLLTFPILTTERLVLRKLSFNDKEKVHMLRSDEKVNEYINRPISKNLREAEDFITKVTKGYEDEKNINWSITLRENNEMIGSICLWNFSNDRKVAEVGYDLDPKFHNKGYMTESLKVVVKFGFENLKLESIEAFTSYRNESSKRLLIKNGFTLNDNRKDEDDPENKIYELRL